MTRRDPPIEIIYYTDPYCTWCWGSEPILRHIQETYGDQVKLTYKMGGLVENIETFYDHTNDISSISQVAPHWLEASSRHGMPVDVAVFDKIKDEMRSTYPANIAYKAAELQDTVLAKEYLRRLREAAASEQSPIHRIETQIELAKEVGLDIERFSAALKSGRAKEAFEADLHEARSQGISGFPTFIIRNANDDQLLVHGYRPFSYFVRVFERLAPTPLATHDPGDIQSFVKKYGRVATQEILETFDLSQDDALAALVELAKEGQIKRVPLGNGDFWEPLLQH
ncbi:MAG TPA: DsbA family protein [Actinobacteria bacterium]|nr:DsbA family protein [Actinomycetota bacterium]